MRCLCAAAVVLVCTSLVLAQDEPTPEQLKKMYDDALVQLKAAQDRKNELGTKNEELAARVAELEKQLQEARREAACHAEQTFFLRSHYAAWQRFLRRYPDLQARWETFLGADVLGAPHDVPDWLDPRWPLPAQG